MQFVKPDNWIAFRDGLPPASFLYEPLIPAHGVTLIHGPPSCGKSAFTWGVGNAIATGSPYLNLTTNRTEVLLLSNDMSNHEIVQRWGDAFTPRFTFTCVDKFNCTKKDFLSSKVYHEVKNYIAANSIGLVMIDALGGCHAGESAKEDETATMTDVVLRQWLEPAAIILVAHDRKIQMKRDGKPIDPSDEDCLGSQLWRSNATSQIHMAKINEHMSALFHSKSQVSVQHPDNIKLYIDLKGMAELWDQHKADNVIKKFNHAIDELGLQKSKPSAQVRSVANYYGISERMVWRWWEILKGERNVK